MLNKMDIKTGKYFEEFKSLNSKIKEDETLQQYAIHLASMFPSQKNLMAVLEVGNDKKALIYLCNSLRGILEYNHTL